MKVFTNIDFYILPVISVAVFFLAQVIFKKTKIAPPITYLALSFILSKNFLNIINPEIFPSIAGYSSLALYLLFFSGGFNLDLRNFSKTGVTTLKLSVFPVYVETFVMFLVTYFIFSNIPGATWNLSIAGSFLTSGLYAMSSPANVIPITMMHLSQGRTGHKGIAQTMVVTSILDNFAPIFVVLIAGALVIGPGMGLGTEPVSIAGMSLVAMVVFFVLGITFGVLLEKITHSYGKVIGEGKGMPLAFAFCLFVALVGFITGLKYVPLVSGMIGFFGILIAMAAGTGIKLVAAPMQARITGMSLGKLFAMIGMPIVFLSVGSKVNLTVLANPMIILGCLAFVALSLFTKLTTAYFVMSDPAFTMDDKKYAMACFIPKGVTLVNFSALMAAILQDEPTGLIPAMVVLAAVTILLTIPLGVTLMANKGAVWLVKPAPPVDPKAAKVAPKKGQK